MSKFISAVVSVFSPPPKKQKPLPLPASATSEAQKEAANQASQVNRDRVKRRATVLTGGAGVEETNAVEIRRKQLLGA
jgi:nucleoside phosphorylase